MFKTSGRPAFHSTSLRMVPGKAKMPTRYKGTAAEAQLAAEMIAAL